MDHTPVPVRNYLLIFTGAYAVALVVVAVILQLTDTSRGISYAAFFAAIGFAAARFAKDQNRVPDPNERLKFAFGSTLISLSLSVLFMGLILLYLSAQAGGPGALAELSELFWSQGGALMLVVMIVFSGINFAAAYFMFRWMAGSTLKAIERRKAKTAPRLF